MYGPEIFYEDAIDLVYPEAVEAAMKEAGHTLVAPPADVEIVSVGKEGVDFKFKATVKPEVEIGTYKGLKAYKEEIKVEAAEVDARIEELRDRNSRMVTVEDRAAKDGDMVEIDFEGFVGGEAFDGGKAENYNLTLGSGSFIPGFEEQIAGHNSGDEFEIASSRRITHRSSPGRMPPLRSSCTRSRRSSSPRWMMSSSRMSASLRRSTS